VDCGLIHIHKHPPEINPVLCGPRRVGLSIPIGQHFVLCDVSLFLPNSAMPLQSRNRTAVALLFSAILPFPQYNLTQHLLQLFNSPKDLVTQNDGNKVVLFFEPRLFFVSWYN